MEANTALFWLLVAAALIAAVDSHTHAGDEEAKENELLHNSTVEGWLDNKSYIMATLSDDHSKKNDTDEEQASDHRRSYAIDQVYFKLIQGDSNTEFTAANLNPLDNTDFNVSWPTTIIIGDYPSLLESIMVVVAHWRTLKKKQASNLIVVGWGGRDVFPRGQPSTSSSRQIPPFLGGGGSTGGGGLPPGVEYPGEEPPERERTDYKFVMPDYMPLVNQVEPTATKVSEVITALVNSRGLDITKTVLLAHGLGCHVAGSVGRANQQLKMIVAIEPSRAWYKNQTVDNRLDPDDGNVFVIHGHKSRYSFRGALGDTDLFLHFKEKTGFFNYCHYIYAAYAVGAALLSEAALPSLMHGFLCDSKEYLKKGYCMDPTTAITLTYEWDDIRPGNYFAQLYYNVDTDISVAITPNFDAVFPHYNCEYQYMFPSPTTVIKVTSDTVKSPGSIYIDASVEVFLGLHYTNTTFLNIVSKRNKKLDVDHDRLYAPLGSLRANPMYPDIKITLMARNIRPTMGNIHVNKLTFELIGEISGQVETYVWCDLEMVEWDKYTRTLSPGTTC